MSKEHVQYINKRSKSFKRIMNAPGVEGLFGIDKEERVFHAVMRQGRESMGMNRQEFGEHIGVSGSRIGQLENLDVYPGDKVRMKIANALKVDPDRVFPQWMREFFPPPAPPRRAVVVYGEERVSRARLIKARMVEREFGTASINPQEQAEAGNLHDVFEEFFGGGLFSPRELEILKKTYGWDGERHWTLEDLSKEFYVGRERVRQILKSALAKLRHPTRSWKLIDFVDIYPRSSLGIQQGQGKEPEIQENILLHPVKTLRRPTILKEKLAPKQIQRQVEKTLGSPEKWNHVVYQQQKENSALVIEEGVSKVDSIPLEELTEAVPLPLPGFLAAIRKLFKRAIEVLKSEKKHSKK